MGEQSYVPDTLRKFFADNPKPALAFSGGVDSTYLFYAAVQCKAEVYAYYVKTQFQPMFELEDAKKTAELLGQDLHVILRNILSNTKIRSNPENRCYLCKKELFETISEQARSDKRRIVIDATNASDDPDERPGMKALEEMKVLSPLRMCGITKKDIRELSKEAGLWTWDLPSNSCLATRIPFGIELTEERLLRTEEAEDELRQLGLKDFRIRSVDTMARLETSESQKELVSDIKPEIERILLRHYSEIEYTTRSPRL